MDPFDHPRFQNNPIAFFFEQYILDVIGELGYKQRQILDELNLNDLFNARAAHWRAVVEEKLRLSETFQIAILDKWYRCVDEAEGKELEPNMEEFIRKFGDSFFSQHSDVDVWADASALEAARERIKLSKMNQKTETI